MDIVSRTGSSSKFIDEDSEFFRQVQVLIPWKILSVQVTYLPRPNA